MEHQHGRGHLDCHAGNGHELGGARLRAARGCGRPRFPADVGAAGDPGRQHPRDDGAGRQAGHGRAGPRA